LAQTAPDDPNVYWEITVVAPFPALNVLFLPGHTYRVRQSVYDTIKGQCATATIVPENVSV
jgi:hypothetical protein